MVSQRPARWRASGWSSGCSRHRSLKIFIAKHLQQFGLPIDCGFEPSGFMIHNPSPLYEPKAMCGPSGDHTGWKAVPVLVNRVRTGLQLAHHHQIEQLERRFKRAAAALRTRRRNRDRARRDRTFSPSCLCVSSLAGTSKADVAPQHRLVLRATGTPLRIVRRLLVARRTQLQLFAHGLTQLARSRTYAHESSSYPVFARPLFFRKPLSPQESAA